MSVAGATPAAARRPVPRPSRPSAKTRVAAILIVVALAALSAYALFSGPTPIPGGAQRTTAPAQAPQTVPPGDETRGGEGGD